MSNCWADSTRFTVFSYSFINIQWLDVEMTSMISCPPIPAKLPALLNHARNRPFPLRHVDPHLTHKCLGPPHSPRQTTARSLYAIQHNDATNSPLVTMGRRKFTPPKLPLPFDDHHQNLIHPFRARPDSPVTTPNGIQIQSAVSPQYMCGQTDVGRHGQ